MKKTLSTWLQHSARELANSGIESARLDCLVLLEDVTGKNRAHLLAHPELELSAEQERNLGVLLNRRTKHEPLAYIRGTAEFYGHVFAINDRVLVPRPESEDIINLLSEYGDTPTIIDVGTGSGALAVSAALLRPSADVYAIDIDETCLDVTRRNAKTLGASVTVRHGDLLRNIPLDEFPGPIFILANLPYVPNEYDINAAARHEPDIALFGGKDGLDPYRIMFNQLSDFDEQTIIVLTESLVSQHTTLAGIAHDNGFAQSGKRGLIQSFTYLPI